MSRQSLVLASQSPQRKALLEQLGLTFQVVVPHLEKEGLDDHLSIEKAIEKLAFEKAQSVSSSVAEDALIIGCDTLVLLDDVPLGKPRDKSEAKQMLFALSGKSHRVVSGLALIDKKTGVCRTCHAVTTVNMRELDDKTVNAYLSTKESMGRAGAYAIQGCGVLLTAGIEGSYTNVVGMPLESLERLFASFGKDLLAYE